MGDREKRGREVYGRREKRGREAGFPRWREAGEKGKNYAIFRNRKNAKGRSQKIQGGHRDYRVQEAGGLNPSVPPPPPLKVRPRETGDTKAKSWSKRFRTLALNSRDPPFQVKVGALGLHLIVLRLHFFLGSL